MRKWKGYQIALLVGSIAIAYQYIYYFGRLPIDVYFFTVLKGMFIIGAAFFAVFKLEIPLRGITPIALILFWLAWLQTFGELYDRFGYKNWVTAEPMKTLITIALAVWLVWSWVVKESWRV